MVSDSVDLIWEYISNLTFVVGSNHTCTIKTSATYRPQVSLTTLGYQTNTRLALLRQWVMVSRKTRPNPATGVTAVKCVSLNKWLKVLFMFYLGNLFTVVVVCWLQGQKQTHQPYQFVPAGLFWTAPSLINSFSCFAFSSSETFEATELNAKLPCTIKR